MGTLKWLVPSPRLFQQFLPAKIFGSLGLAEDCWFLFLEFIYSREICQSFDLMNFVLIYWKSYRLCWSSFDWACSLNQKLWHYHTSILFLVIPSYKKYWLQSCWVWMVFRLPTFSLLLNHPRLNFIPNFQTNLNPKMLKMTDIEIGCC